MFGARRNFLTCTKIVSKYQNMCRYITYLFCDYCLVILVIPAHTENGKHGFYIAVFKYYISTYYTRRNFSDFCKYYLLLDICEISFSHVYVCLLFYETLFCFLKIINLILLNLLLFFRGLLI